MQDTSKPPMHEPAAAPSSLGAWLAETRMARDLEQREVAGRLNVDWHVVQALENDEFRSLGASVFVRFYLKRYAQFLNLSEQDVLARYDALGLDKPPPLEVKRPIKPQTKGTDFRWLAYPVVVAMLGWLGWAGLERVVSHFDSGEDTPPPFAGVSDTNGSAPLSLPLPGSSTTSTPATSPKERIVEAAPAAVETPPTTPPVQTTVASDEAETVVADATEAENATPLAAVLTEAPAAEKTEADEAESNPPLADGKHKLVLAFSDDCWVEIRDADNERLAYGVIKADTTSTLFGTAPFRLTLGNAGAATITLDGTEIERSVYIPRRGTVSRFTLEAPQG